MQRYVSHSEQCSGVQTLSKSHMCGSAITPPELELNKRDATDIITFFGRVTVPQLFY